MFVQTEEKIVEVKPETPDRVLIKKWVEALRSGRYKKGADRMRDDEQTFCALGVLADVFDPTYWRTDTNTNYKWRYAGDTVQDGEGYYRYVFTQATKRPDIIRVIPSMNDGTASWKNHPQSFMQIADYIERNCLKEE